MKKLTIGLLYIIFTTSLKAQERANAHYFDPDYTKPVGVYMNVPDPKYFDFKKKDSNAGGYYTATFILTEQGSSTGQIQSSISQKLKNLQSRLNANGVIYSSFKNEFLGVSRQLSPNRLTTTIELKKKISICYRDADKLQTIIDSFLVSDLVIELQEVSGKE